MNFMKSCFKSSIKYLKNNNKYWIIFNTFYFFLLFYQKNMIINEMLKKKISICLDKIKNFLKEKRFSYHIDNN